jgi:transcriptional regulator with XRE-family HTH domain
VRIQPEKLKALCRERHLSLKDLLAEAGVSRTAYYSLLRKDSVLPKSLHRLALRLGVGPACFLDDDDERVGHVRDLQAKAEAIQRLHPECDRDVVLRTLRNLELPPAERLRRALIRGRRSHIHR